MVCERWWIAGQVQGVGYRYWMREKAPALGVDGWVRNRGDGRVEALVSAERAALAELRRACLDGPPSAVVRDISVAPADEAVAPGFEQRPTV